MIVSSAMSQTVDIMVIGMLLILSMKSAKHITELWRTPEVTEQASEMAPSRTTNCIWPEGKEVIHPIT